MPGDEIRENKTRIYVGNLPPDIRSKDIEDLFYKYGKIVFIDLKNRRGPPFSFVEFEDPRDAEDAVYARDGYDYDGYKLRVEFPRGGGFRGATGAATYGEGGRARGPPARRSSFRCIVSGLPPTGSWQDLKDHMREAGDVCFADVFKDGTGAVEYTRREDLQYAVTKLDDTRFKSHEGESAHIHVVEDEAAAANREDGRDDDRDDDRGGRGDRDRGGRDRGDRDRGDRDRGDRGDRDRGGRGGGGGGSRRRSKSRSRSPKRGGRRGSPSYSPVRRRRSRSRS